MSPPLAGPFQSAAPVCCRDCQHFLPDTVGDGTGFGRCQGNRGGHFPYERHPCLTFQRANETARYC